MVLVGMLFWGPMLLGVVFLVGYGLICLASAGPLALFQYFVCPVGVVAVPMLIAIAIVRPKYSVLELDSSGICLLGSGASSACFTPYASIRSVQTYLDQGFGGAMRRGVIFGVDGGQGVTLELGKNTGAVVETICHHTHLVALHSRWNWVREATGGYRCC